MTDLANAGGLVAGVVGRPHGLDGSFHVRRARAALLTSGTEVSVAGRRAVIERRAGTASKPIVRLSGIGDRDAAGTLAGEDLVVAAGGTPALGEDEWYAEELIGCAVADGKREVGTVRRLLPLPSCEALEVARPEGGELLVPLVRDAVRSVDVEGRRIDVDMAFVAPDEERP